MNGPMTAYPCPCNVTDPGIPTSVMRAMREECPHHPQPVYDKEGITIYLGNCLDVLPTLTAVDHVITDPPFNAATHNGAMAGNRRGARETNRLLGIDFEALTPNDLRAIFALCPASRWLISSLAYQHTVALEESPPDGWEFVRFGVWRKPDSTPQFSGDRPGMGWESIAILHRPGRKRWNGGGNHAVWTYRIAGKGAEHYHPTEKPLALLKHLVSDFTDPGDLILDPFMGSGTTLVAAKELGRRAIGIELNEKYVQTAIRRLEATAYKPRLLPPAPAPAAQGGLML